ncbi:MAG: hypothetical protein WD002_03065 [Pseudomonadales bacterium]
MVEILVFTVVGIFVYLLADAALNALEKMHGEPIPYRSIVFFVVFFLLIIISFNMINLLFGAGANA